MGPWSKGASEAGETDKTGRRVFSYSPLVFSFYPLSRRSWYTQDTWDFGSCCFISRTRQGLGSVHGKLQVAESVCVY